MVAHSRPSWERYAWSILDLAAHIRDSDKTEDVKKLEAHVWKEDGSAQPPGKWYYDLHHAIIELVESKQLLQGKVRRSLVGA